MGQGTQLTAAVMAIVVGENSVEVRYRISNKSAGDIWVCDDVDLLGWQAEVCIADKGQTILLRRCLDVPLSIFTQPPKGRYVRLAGGQSRIESLYLQLPVCVQPVFQACADSEGSGYASRLRIQIGYYNIDLPSAIRGILQRPVQKKGHVSDDDPAMYLGGLSGFNAANESHCIRHRDEELLVSYSFQSLKGEKILQLDLDGIRIPYDTRCEPPRPAPPALDSCTRLEIQFDNSALHFFFPYAAAQMLLSEPETEYLATLKSVVAIDQDAIYTVANEIRGEAAPSVVTTEYSKADIFCYRESERLTSFTAYNNAFIVTREQQRLRYRAGLRNVSQLAPEIRPFALRVQCANNLADLHGRLTTYAAERRERAYPPMSTWSDVIVDQYTAWDYTSEFIIRPFKCLGAGKGRCHYAMNTRCQVDSPGDVVLLFETKMGWNQHGGLELFTFDNHDPKGGCVLLNDGTVKFIRTEEELHALRWK
jgi:hypothetical protein